MLLCKTYSLIVEQWSCRRNRCSLLQRHKFLLWKITRALFVTSQNSHFLINFVKNTLGKNTFLGLCGFRHFKYKCGVDVFYPLTVSSINLIYSRHKFRDDTQIYSLYDRQSDTGITQSPISGTGKNNVASFQSCSVGVIFFYSALKTKAAGFCEMLAICARITASPSRRWLYSTHCSDVKCQQ
jgi:hypothetical protein